jgi:hypothetical protein
LPDQNGFKALIVGGTEDHVHILRSLPASASSQGGTTGERCLIPVDE